MSQTLTKEIKQKKELAGLADKVVEETLNDYLKKYNISLENLTKPSRKILIKEIRAQLRKLESVASVIQEASFSHSLEPCIALHRSIRDTP